MLNSIDNENSRDHQLDDGSLKKNYDENDNFLVKNSLYLQKNFAADALNECDTLLRSFPKDSQVSNYYHDQNLANYFVRKMSPFAPLWSSFIHNRLTNNLIEARHKVLKKNIFLSKVNSKASDVVKELRAETLAQLKNAKMMGTLKKRPKIEKVNDPQENFKKINRAKPSTFAKNEIRLKTIEIESKSLAMIKEILNLPHDSTSFRTIGTIELRKRDFLTLDKENWLNDNIIFSYLNFVCDETAYIFDSILFSKIKSLGFPIGESYIRNFKIENYKEIIFPINSNSHWKLCHADVKKHKFYMYDSMISIYQNYDVYVVQKILEFCSRSTWDFETIQCSRQTNGHDCGIYVLEFARKIVQNRNLSISANKTSLIRKRILIELYERKLFSDYSLFDVIYKYLLNLFSIGKIYIIMIRKSRVS